MMRFEIRMAEPEDARSLSRLILALAEKYVTHECSQPVAAVFLSSISEPEIVRKLVHGFTYYVAVSDGVITGVMGIEDVHIYHLFVSEVYHQHTGVARRLLHTVQSAFEAQSLSWEFTVNSSIFAGASAPVPV